MVKRRLRRGLTNNDDIYVFNPSIVLSCYVGRHLGWHSTMVGLRGAQQRYNRHKFLKIYMYTVVGEVIVTKLLRYVATF